MNDFTFYYCEYFNLTIYTFLKEKIVLNRTFIKKKSSTNLFFFITLTTTTTVKFFFRYILNISNLIWSFVIVPRLGTRVYNRSIR